MHKAVEGGRAARLTCQYPSAPSPPLQTSYRPFLSPWESGSCPAVASGCWALSSFYSGATSSSSAGGPFPSPVCGRVTFEDGEEAMGSGDRLGFKSRSLISWGRQCWSSAQIYFTVSMRPSSSLAVLLPPTACSVTLLWRAGL